MSHIATVRSSARMAHNRAKESQQQGTTARRSSANSIPNVDNLNDEFSEISVISISSSEGGDPVREMSQTGRQRIRQESETTSTSIKSTPVKNVQSPRPMLAPLDRLDTLSDIEACVDGDLSQFDVLNRLQDQWHNITNNIETVLDHLQECSDQVTEASNNCLQTLVNSIESTCDSVDNQVKALYHLMTKCDELTTKLSAAGSFRDEIKTLRKSVDTLENLYKSKPGTVQQRTPVS